MRHDLHVPVSMTSARNHRVPAIWLIYHSHGCLRGSAEVRSNGLIRLAGLSHDAQGNFQLIHSVHSYMVINFAESVIHIKNLRKQPEADTKTAQMALYGIITREITNKYQACNE